ncbi:ABC transporter substrate-binding protein [Rubrobacter marinus]|uniref:ABC transporter substrate-binding protein n=1 Tax=Rubrobacter marinus TaxID=2653852 RepID=A0A6G8PTH5_9ACTN|nr:cobalamin-binding protein [Rubrobacter marinus]QIN77633.1 ABC transporter substrate-binding protein [Rubrobacter marinus]
MRVVSLLPSATELLSFVGASEELVGVSHECDYPAGVEALPKLTRPPIDHHAMTSAEIDAAIGRHLSETGSLYALDAELLEELKPDLILTQGLCDVCAVSLDVVREAATGLSTNPRVLSMNPTTLGEVLACAVEVGDAVGRGSAARESVAALGERLVRVREAVEGLPRPRVGAIEWLDPPFSAGHWVPEMVRLAGGEDLFAREGEPSARLRWGDVFAAEPEVLVLMPCGFDKERALLEARPLPRLEGWSGVPAVRSGRVWAVDGNSFFSRPAPRLVEGVEILARLLHPEAFAGPPPATAARRLDPSLPEAASPTP